MILVTYGTRPEIIKLFPVVQALRKRGLPHRTLFTGQQTDLYEDVKDLVPPPDFTFAGLFSGKRKHNTLGGSYAKICQAAELLYARDRFDVVVVQGDTTTAWALAQMAFYNNVRIAHVEAGLRTFDLMSPYPEELNRTLISQIADYNFAPTRQAVENLSRSGAKNVHLVGNTIVDAVDHFRQTLGLRDETTPLVPVTLHRRENHAIMDILFEELEAIAEKNRDLDFILPIHPNPNVQKHRHLIRAANIRVIEPVGYPDMLRMISRAAFLITDSGGIQEEATCFNKKVIIAREKTERPEVIDIGLGRLAGHNLAKEVSWARIPPKGAAAYPYGDGHAADKITDILSGQMS
jgi:UDP-N-acetylglucosamine 2-epimerase (non-hydrolysing)